MGCWNETCMLTQLPIHCGEPVYGFLGLMIRSEFIPIPIPIQGNYDDYGGIQDIKETVGVQHIVKYFNEKMYHDEEALDRLKRLGYKDPLKKPLHIYDLLNIVQQEGVVYVQDEKDWMTRNAPVEIGMVMIRKSALDNVLSKWKFKAPYRPEDYMHHTYNDSVSNAKEYIQSRMEKVPDNPIIRELSSYSGMDQNTKYCVTLSAFNSMEMPPTRIIDCPKILADMINNKEDIDATVEFFNDMLLYGWLSTFLYWTRKTWHITGGKGSQMGLTKAQELFSKVLNQEVSSMKKRLRAEHEAYYDGKQFKKYPFTLEG